MILGFVLIVNSSCTSSSSTLIFPIPMNLFFGRLSYLAEYFVASSVNVTTLSLFLYVNFFIPILYLYRL